MPGTPQMEGRPGRVGVVAAAVDPAAGPEGTGAAGTPSPAAWSSVASGRSGLAAVPIPETGLDRQAMSRPTRSPTRVWDSTQAPTTSSSSPAVDPDGWRSISPPPAPGRG